MSKHQSRGRGSLDPYVWVEKGGVPLLVHYSLELARALFFFFFLRLLFAFIVFFFRFLNV